MHHHLDFDCSENEIKCTKCKDKFKKKDLDKHVKMECQYSKVQCSKCTNSFLRSEIQSHDCLLTLIKKV